jgi:hypothetical protein
MSVCRRRALGPRISRPPFGANDNIREPRAAGLYRGASSLMRSLAVLAIASPAATSNALIAAQTPIWRAGVKAT